MLAMNARVYFLKGLRHSMSMGRMCEVIEGLRVNFPWLDKFDFGDRTSVKLPCDPFIALPNVKEAVRLCENAVVVATVDGARLDPKLRDIARHRNGRSALMLVTASVAVLPLAERELQNWERRAQPLLNKIFS